MLRKGQIVIALVIGLVATVASGCNGLEIAPADLDENVIVAPGKEDNFFSNVAQEYLATAQVAITLDASYKDKTEAEQLARAHTIMEGKTKQIAWFLHVYVIDKSDDDDAGDYGGLRAMVLDGSHDSEALKQDQDDPLKFSYTFEVQVGGITQAAGQDPRGQQPAGRRRHLPAAHGQAGQQQADQLLAQQLRRRRLVPGQLQLRPRDAERHAQRHRGVQGRLHRLHQLLADKVMDISVHVGWDYHARYDITHSRQLYNWLVGSMGFTSPAESYEAYNRLSGPLTKEITVNGQKVQAKVTIFRPDPCEAWDEDGPYGAWAKAVTRTRRRRSAPAPTGPGPTPRPTPTPPPRPAPAT